MIHYLLRQASRIYVDNNAQIWVKQLSSNRKALAIHNMSNDERLIDISFTELGLNAVTRYCDVWKQVNERIKNKRISFDIPRHGVQLMTVK